MSVVSLHRNHEELHDAYCSALAEVLPSVIGWWQSLASRDDLENVALRWPARAAAHPRVIAVFRRYYLECMEINERSREPGSTGIDDESMWGEDPAADDGSRWIHPADLCITDLASECDELFEFMSYLVLNPVGSPIEVDLASPAPSIPPRTFMAPTHHAMDLGIVRLLGAPRDVLPGDTWRERDPPVIGAGHRELFRAYCSQLEAALREADAWWWQIILAREREGRSRDEAIAAAFELVFCGPVGHPDVVGVVRAYWLACEALNADLAVSAKVAPERMLLAWLLDGRHESWVRILTGMPYWPLGLDERGAWV